MVPEGLRGSLQKNVTCPARKHAVSVKNFFFGPQQIFRPPANIRAAVVFRPPANIRAAANISPPTQKKVFFSREKGFFLEEKNSFCS